MSGLAEAFDRIGMPTQHIVFNGGDALYAKSQHKCRGPAGSAEWKAWCRSNIVAGDVAIIIAFGFDRPRHKIAYDVAQLTGIPFLALEEGYLRPGFVTAEWEGNNAMSPLKDRQLGTPTGSLATEPWLGRTSAQTLYWSGAFYHIARAIMQPFYRDALYHKHRPVVPEALLWTRSLARRIARSMPDRRSIARLTGTLSGRYVLVPLQVHDDQQLLVHGNGWTNETLIDATLISFARHASHDMHLVVKVHPMDRGHSHFRSLVRRKSKQLGLSGRVHALSTGSMAELAQHCDRLVTINSTSAHSALYRGKPVGVLGDAVYARPDLVTLLGTREDLDAFWTSAPVDKSKPYQSFSDLMRAEALLPGDYYAKAARQVTTRGIVAKVMTRLKPIKARTVAKAIQG